MDESPHPLSSETKNRTRNLFAPEKVTISPPPQLTPEVIDNHLKLLSPQNLSSVTSTPENLLCFSLLLCDNHGLPYQTSKNTLTTCLEQVDPHKRTWTRILTKTGHKLIKKTQAFDENPDTLNLVCDYYLGHHGQDIFENIHTIGDFVLNLDGPRFTNPDQATDLLVARAQLAEDRRRLATLLPPRESDLWATEISHSLEILPPEPISQIKRPLTLNQKQAIVEMFIETQESLGQNGSGPLLTLIPNFPSIFSDTTPNPDYDPSVDAPDRYRFCLKLAQRFSQRKNGQSDTTEPLVDEILEKIGRNQNRLEDFIDWIAGAGDYPPPKWFFTKNNHGSSAPQAATINNENPAFLDSIPKLHKPTRVIYVDRPEDIPPSLTATDLDSLITTPPYHEIPLADIDGFNRALTKIFGRPSANYHQGERVANTIWVLTQYPDSAFHRVPAADQKHMPHLKKFDAKGQRLGIYGVCLDNPNDRILVITSAAKKTHRDRLF